jgi:hypothetical protein
MEERRFHRLPQVDTSLRLSCCSIQEPDPDPDKILLMTKDRPLHELLGTGVKRLWGSSLQPGHKQAQGTLMAWHRLRAMDVQS